jgi:predicted dienelactone hydrolase
MSGAVRSAQLHRHHHTKSSSRLWLALRNLLLHLGFEEHVRPAAAQTDDKVKPSPQRRTSFTAPKDYFRRRRMKRNLGNVLLIGGLSLATGYVISRPVGGTGFSPVRTAQHPTAPSVASSAAKSPLIDSSGYGQADGPLGVFEASDLVLHDSKRSKDLHVRVFYPEQTGKYPVIVFSHGAGGSQTCCDALTRHWASYGYITIQPTHEDSALQRRNTGEENIRFPPAVREALKKPELWEGRPRDISFVLDSLSSLERRIPGLAGKIDAAHIGVAGHSMGSYTAEAIAGALIDLPNQKRANFLDSRVKAVLCLSPQGPGQFGLTEHSFDRLSLPYLGVTGSLDSLGPVATPAWHKKPFERSVQGDKYHLLIEGANHMSFISANRISAARQSQAEAILGYTNSASLAFWDAYLKGDASAKAYLESDRLEKQSNNAVQLDRR